MWAWEGRKPDPKRHPTAPASVRRLVKMSNSNTGSMADGFGQTVVQIKKSRGVYRILTDRKMSAFPGNLSKVAGVSCFIPF
jgi:hypothetical protein